MLQLIKFYREVSLILFSGSPINVHFVLNNNQRVIVRPKGIFLIPKPTPKIRIRWEWIRIR